MAEPVVIGYGQNKFLKDSNTRVVSLYKHPDNTSGWVAMNESGLTLGTAYQVPAGKKLIVLYMNCISKSSGTQDWQFGYDTTTNWTSASKKYLQMQVMNATTVFNMYPYWEIPAGNYLNMYVSSSGSCLAVGVEVDA